MQPDAADVGSRFRINKNVPERNDVWTEVMTCRCNDDATSRSLSNATLSAAACADGDHNRCYPCTGSYPCTGKEQVTSRPEAAHLGEDLWQYVLDILDVDLVDKSIKGLAEGIPRHALVLIATFVAFLFHHLNAA